MSDSTWLGSAGRPIRPGWASLATAAGPASGWAGGACLVLLRRPAVGLETGGGTL